MDASNIKDFFNDLKMVLKNDKSIRIVTNVKDNTFYVDNTDIVKYKDNLIIIYRANGNITAINTDFVVSFSMISKNNIF